jgi:hypothetical protein
MRKRVNGNPGAAGVRTASWVMAGAVLIVLAGAARAQAKGCTWGQPGYRACVDGLIARQRDVDARRGTDKRSVRPVTRTAPARQRPGTLTPVPSQTWRGVPAPSAVDDQRAVQRNQRDFDNTMNRLRQQANPAPIMPFPELNPIPGRICPTGGC